MRKHIYDIVGALVLVGYEYWFLDVYSGSGMATLICAGCVFIKNYKLYSIKLVITNKNDKFVCDLILMCH